MLAFFGVLPSDCMQKLYYVCISTDLTVDLLYGINSLWAPRGPILAPQRSEMAATVTMPVPIAAAVRRVHAGGLETRLEDPWLTSDGARWWRRGSSSVVVRLGIESVKGCGANVGVPSVFSDR